MNKAMLVNWKKFFKQDPDLYIGLCFILLLPSLALIGGIALMQFAPSKIQPNSLIHHTTVKEE